MVESMTGFARAQVKWADRKITLEIKSVNSKFLDLRLHLPRHYSEHEGKISALIKKSFSRGNIDLFINESEGSGSDNFIDKERAGKFIRQAKRLKKELSLSGEVDIDTLLRNRDLFNSVRNGLEPLKIKTLERLLRTAVSRLKAMRAKEGAHLAKDIKNRLANISKFLDEVDKEKNAIVLSCGDKLRKRAAELSREVKIDSARLEQEIVLYSVKSDISEEVTRLKSHLERMLEFLAKREPVGRKLDFLVQEMNREVNTIGSKAQSLGISRRIVDMKSEIEKIREQVQNIE